LKLTNAIRNKIVEDVLTSKGIRKIAQYAEKAWVKQIMQEWEKCYPPGLHEYKAWVCKASSIYVEDDRHNITDCVYLSSIEEGTNVYRHESGSTCVAQTPEIIRLKDEWLEAKKAVVDAEALIRSVVFSCTTSKQLIDIAPELARFVPDEDQTTALVSVATLDALRQLMTKDVT
jgi:hypothetical protein